MNSVSQEKSILDPSKVDNISIVMYYHDINYAVKQWNTFYYKRKLWVNVLPHLVDNSLEDRIFKFCERSRHI